MTTKMTYAQALDIAISVVTDVEANEKLVALKAQFEKKSSSEKKPTAKQTENSSLKGRILEVMEHGVEYTITDMIKSFDFLSEMSNQKISAMMRQLVEDGSVTRIEKARKAYFTLS